MKRNLLPERAQRIEWVILATAICVATAASTALAHHSHPFFYDVCKTVTIEGRVERVEFKDPHTLVFLKLDDGTAYTVDWAGLRGLTRNRGSIPRKHRWCLALASRSRALAYEARPKYASIFPTSRAS